LAALETLENDAWQQYNELGSSMPICRHTAGAGQPGEVPHPAQQHGDRRPVDTSWWTRYRSDSLNPDFGDTLPQAVPDLAVGEHPGIPRSDADLSPTDHLQAIANTAGFHFAFIEQGGTSLYPSLAQRVTSTEVLRILLSIGPTETMHFQTWQDKAGNAPPLTDPDPNTKAELPWRRQRAAIATHPVRWLSPGARGAGPSPVLGVRAGRRTPRTCRGGRCRPRSS
jgi:hypothetical protein